MKYTDKKHPKNLKPADFCQRLSVSHAVLFFRFYTSGWKFDWSLLRNGAVHQLTNHSHCGCVLYIFRMDAQEVPNLCKGIHTMFSVYDSAHSAS